MLLWLLLLLLLGLREDKVLERGLDEEGDARDRRVLVRGDVTIASLFSEVSAATSSKT